MIPVGSDLELKRTPVATLIIIGINVVVHISQFFLLPQHYPWIIKYLVFSPVTYNPLSVVISMFLHIDFFHLIFNMVFLWAFGAALETRVGRKNFLLTYFGAGIWATALWIVVEAFVRPESTIGLVGASGAVSGVIALYLYRCFYSKIRMVVTLLFLPWRVSIPAAPFIIIWFYQNVIYSVADLTEPSGTAHWAHIGGFIFGLLVGRIKRYGHEGRLEHLNTRLLERLRSGDGWKSAEKELKKLLGVSPNDPVVHHELARLSVQNGDAGLASEHFQRAMHRYALTEPVHAAFVVIEHADTLGKPMALHHHLKAGEALAASGYVEDALRAILPAVRISEAGNAISEKALALYAKVLRHLGKTDAAGEAAARFRELFPESKLAAGVQAAMGKQPNEVFAPPPQKPAAVSSKASVQPEDEDREYTVLGILACFENIISQPYFLFPWICFSLFIGFAFGGFWPLHVLSFMFCFVLAAFIVIDWSSLFRSFSSTSTESARNEVDIIQAFDRASLAERGDNFQKAAELYEKTLALDPRHVQARFNLARIYMNRLLNNAKALLHTRRLLQHLPPAHPYHGEAQDMVLKLKVKLAKE